MARCIVCGRLPSEECCRTCHAVHDALQDIWEEHKHTDPHERGTLERGTLDNRTHERLEYTGRRCDMTTQRKPRTEYDRIIDQYEALPDRKKQSAFHYLLGRTVVRDPELVREAIAFARGERRAF